VTTTSRPEPYAVGKRPGLRIDTPELADDLKLLVAEHGNITDALRAAITLAASVARGEQITVDTKPLGLDLRLLARCGLPDPADAIRWAIDHAATNVQHQWSTTGQLPNLAQPQED
jgi:hypothetical protein